jgi:glycosyltransferase involved in cell wall biosynthesis
MAVRAAIAIPTRNRPRYLDVALASICPQAAEHGAEVVVIDDGPDPLTRAVATRHGAQYVAHDGPRGLNVARNTAIDVTDAPLLAYVDDDVEAAPGWLAALLGAAADCPPEIGVFTGPIRPRIEDHRYRSCGREGPPVTFLDLGPADVDTTRGWGANFAVRRAALDAVGRFAEHLVNGGDEEEWQARWLARGGRIRYIAAAGVDHRRCGDDARLRSLARAAYHRGRAARRFDAATGRAPSLAAEARVLAGCAVHGPRRLCFNGVTMTAHSLGRIRAALLERPDTPRTADAAATAPADPGADFLSGASGTVGGKRGALRRAADASLDALDALTGRRARLARAAAATPARRRVLVLGIERPGMIMDAARTELARSRHEVEVHTAPPGTRGKFENLNALLAAHPPDGFDWVIVMDDDVALPRGFLDRFLHVAEDAGLRLAQPAHRLHSHAAWAITRRRPGVAARETTFVEIGPVTAYHRDTFATLLPFPELRMGWGLDAHWAAVARDHGWRIGIVDATPVGHTLAPVGAGYGREAAIAEARAFLADRPYVRRDEVRTLQVHR